MRCFLKTKVREYLTNICLYVKIELLNGEGLMRRLWMLKTEFTFA